MWRPLLTLSALVISAPCLPLKCRKPPSGGERLCRAKAEPDMLTLNVSVTALEKQGIKAKQQVDGKVAASLASWKGWASSAAMWRRAIW